MFFFISLYMQQVLGYSAIKAGLSYLPLALTIIISAGIASQLTTRVGFKPVLAAGMAFIAAGLVWFSQVSVGGSFAADILGPSLLAAVGLGFAFVPQTIAAVAGVRDHEAGLASGLINTSQQVGGALGLAVLATIANTRTDDLLRRRRRAGDGAHRGLPVRLPGRRRDRDPRPDRGPDPDPQPRQPRPRRDRAQPALRERRRSPRLTDAALLRRLRALRHLAARRARRSRRRRSAAKVLWVGPW